MSSAGYSSASNSSTRMVSIDALRGFDMFWIMGGEDVVKALADWGQWSWSEQLKTQLKHVEWEGFRFYDLIFPLFLFIVGVVLPFSLNKPVQSREPRKQLYWRILRRTVLLFALGLVYNGILQFDFNDLRIAGVLQRIALCYGIAAIITLNTNVRTQALIAAGLLVGYWLLLALVPASGGVSGDYSMEGNLPGYVDRHWLPGKIKQAYYGYGDNEGILSTIPAISTALMGVLAGHWLRSKQSPWHKVAGLAVGGIACLLAGWFWSLSFPIIKNIWTSSFVLVAGGWSLLLLAVFYAIIDVLRFRGWVFFFVVIGANSILIYLLPDVLDFKHTAQFLFGGVIKHSGNLQPVVLEISVVMAEWLLLLYLYRKRILLRV